MAQTLEAGPDPAQQAKAHGETATRTTTFDRLSRAGFAARAAIYGIIAVLALQLALGQGGKATNQQGALETLADSSFGTILLVLVAIGLGGYALWRITRAIIGRGPEAGEDDPKDRATGLVSGILHAALCVTAVQILVGGGSSGGGAKQATGGVLDWPGGRWIVGIGGVILMIGALDQVKKAIKKEFLEESKTERMDRRTLTGFTRVGQAGYLARGVVFALIGYFLLRAAIDYDADKAVSLDGALGKLAQAPAGPVALGVVALGLLAFAVYCALDTRYRRV